MLTDKGVPAESILYATMDHPLLKLAWLEQVIKTWQELDTKAYTRFIFIDEIQCAKDWETWVKFTVDFSKENRIVFTGSALPIANESSESGVGRWHTCSMHTLSFYEYMEIRNSDEVAIPPIKSLSELFTISPVELRRIGALSESYKGHFYEYLLRGGFPQTALVAGISKAQQLISEDIIDKIVKRDMTAFFGVRHVVDLESLFLFICLHDGSLIEMKTLCENLEIKRPTVQSYLEILEAAHLITRLKPFGFGKDILRGKVKVYLSDPSIAPSVLLKDKTLLSDQQALGQCAKSAICKHLTKQASAKKFFFSFWRSNKKHEVDFIASDGKSSIPFEVKYREQHTDKKDFLGLIEFFKEKNPDHGYVITKNSSDIGLVPWAKCMKIPAHLFCWWMGQNDSAEFAV
ncbi:MAG: ATP-binding protein [Desulfovibrio sp.]|nr:ATP-binding protein [Desulfovibrio sp.]